MNQLVYTNDEETVSMYDEVTNTLTQSVYESQPSLSLLFASKVLQGCPPHQTITPCISCIMTTDKEEH